MPSPGNVRVRIEAKRSNKTAGLPVKPASSDSESTLNVFGLSTEEIRRFANDVKRQSFAGRSTIIRQGDPADAFYVVASGSVVVVRERPDGTEQHVADIGAGGYFGEIGLLHGVPRTATVRAADGGATVLVIGRDLFVHMAGEHDLVSDEIAEMAKRRVMVNQLAEAVPSLNHTALAGVSAHLKRETFRADEVVIRQGAEPDKFYVVVSGGAEVVNHHPGGEDTVLGSLGCGDFFGEIGIIKNQPRMATVRAVTDLEVLALDREHFLALSDADHRTGQSIAEKAVERLLAAKA
jgi:CRP-like cAMP-binding protein